MVGIVLVEQYNFVFDQPGQENAAFFHGNQWTNIVAHHVGEGEVTECWDEVGGEEDLAAFVIDQRQLLGLGMAIDHFELYIGKQFGFAVEQTKLPAVHDRLDVFREETGFFAGIGVECPGEVTALDPEVGIFKCNFMALLDRMPFGTAATMVKMQVGQDYIGDVAFVKAQSFQRTIQGIDLIIQPINPGKLLIVLLSNAVVHQDETVFILDQEATHGHVDAVFFIGGIGPLPDWFRNHPKHGPAVELEVTGFYCMQFHRVKIMAAHFKLIAYGIRGRFPSLYQSMEDVKIMRDKQNSGPESADLSSKRSESGADQTGGDLIQGMGFGEEEPLSYEARTYYPSEAPVQRSVGIEVETGVPVYHRYAGNAHGENPDIIGMANNDVDYSREIRADQNGVELHADSNKEFYKDIWEHYDQKIRPNNGGLPEMKDPHPEILEFVTSVDGLVDETGIDGKANLVAHLDEMERQIDGFYASGPHAVGAFRTGMNNAWPIFDLMARAGLFAQINLGIDLASIADVFEAPPAEAVRGHSNTTGDATADLTTGAAAIAKKSAVSMAKVNFQEQKTHDDLGKPSERTIKSLAGILATVFLYYAGTKANLAGDSIEKNHTPFLLKASFTEIWEAMLRQFPPDQEVSKVDLAPWFRVLIGNISDAEDGYRLGVEPARRFFSGYQYPSQVIAALADGDGFEVNEIATGNPLPLDSGTNYLAEKALSDYGDKKGDLPKSAIAMPVYEVRHLKRVRDFDGIREQVMTVVESVLKIQFDSLDRYSKARILEESKW